MKKIIVAVFSLFFAINAFAEIDTSIIKSQNSEEIKHVFEPYLKDCQNCKTYKLNIEKRRLGDNFDQNMNGRTVWIIHSVSPVYFITEVNGKWIIEATFMAYDFWTKEKAYKLSVVNGEVFIQLDDQMTKQSIEEVESDVTSFLRVMNSRVYKMTGENELKNKKAWSEKEVKG